MKSFKHQVIDVLLRDIDKLWTSSMLFEALYPFDLKIKKRNVDHSIFLLRNQVYLNVMVRHSRNNPSWYKPNENILLFQGVDKLSLDILDEHMRTMRADVKVGKGMQVVYANPYDQLTRTFELIPEQKGEQIAFTSVHSDREHKKTRVYPGTPSYDY
jgi:hypothetical protein